MVYATGQEVTVTGIGRTDRNGSVQMSLSDGTQMDLAGLEFENPAVKELMVAASEYPTAAARTFTSGYDGSIPLSLYSMGFDYLYQQAINGMPLEQAVATSGEIGQMLSPQVQYLAYTAGRNVAEGVVDDGGSLYLENVYDTMNEKEAVLNKGDESGTQNAPRTTQNVKKVVVGNVVYTYHPASEQEISPEARRTQEYLREYGINSYVVDGTVTASSGDRIQTSDAQGMTIRGGTVLIQKAVTIDPKQIAAHEMFHSALKMDISQAHDFYEVIVSHIDLHSDRFARFSQDLNRIYFKDAPADESSPQFMEELCAFVSGYLNEGGMEHADIAYMFRSFDDVKSAWDNLDLAMRLQAEKEETGHESKQHTSQSKGLGEENDGFDQPVLRGGTGISSDRASHERAEGNIRKNDRGSQTENSGKEGGESKESIDERQPLFDDIRNLENDAGLEFENPAVKELMVAASEYPTAAARTFTSGYDGSIPLSLYSMGFDYLYQQAINGMPLEQAVATSGEIGQMLSPQVQYLAYTAGRNVAEGTFEDTYASSSVEQNNLQNYDNGDMIKNVTKDAAQPTQDNSGGDGDGPSEEDLENSRKNIREFVNGRKKFTEVIDDYAKVYERLVKSNKPWKWAKNVEGGKKLTTGQRRKIKRYAEEKGYIVKVNIIKKGLKLRFGIADFKDAGLVKETLYLPEDMWNISDVKQFKWLDDQIGGPVEGYTWHHTENPGEMELVPFGYHNITTHNGGRTKGFWAFGKR